MSKIMSAGSTGPRVAQLERKLDRLGLLQGKPDNTFDKRTEKAVVAWKTQNGWEDPKPVVGKPMSKALGLKGEFTTVGSETPSKMKGGTFNCLIGRPPAEVGRVVEKITKEHDLDFIQLQEISQYHQVLNKIPGYHLVSFKGSKDHGESGVLVRDGLEAKFPKSIEAETGWTNQHGGVAQPRAAVSVRLAGWLRVASIHAPPAVDFKNGHPVGGAARVKSYQSLMRKLAEAAIRQHKRNPDIGVLYGGDWNEGARTGGPGSPSWLAEQAKLKKFGNGRIDWEMGSGVQLTNMVTRGNYGSDHKLVTFSVSRPK